MDYDFWMQPKSKRPSTDVSDIMEMVEMEVVDMIRINNLAIYSIG